MRIIKAPRATWQTCWHMLVVAIAAALGAIAFTLVIVGIWSESEKVGWTAAATSVLAVLLALIGGIAHADSRRHDADLAIALPWRRRVEDDA